MYSWVGRKLGGNASAVEARAAIAWANVAAILLLLLYTLQILIFGREFFTTATPLIEQSLILRLILVGFSIIEIVIDGWSFFILVKNLAEVHRFSAWKGLATYLLGTLILALPFLCIAFPLLLMR